MLILTQAGDLHAHAVDIGLRKKGIDTLLYYSSDFPSRETESALFREGRKQLWLGELGEVAEEEIRTVWRRRPAYALDREKLHPADRQFAEWQCMAFRSSLFDVLAPRAFWVNRPEVAARASRKILQHELALKMGLSVPETLYSNDPNAIRAFLREQGGEAVYKTFLSMVWEAPDTHWLPYTSRLSERELVDDEILRAVPGIYQALVPKAFELRVSFIGKRAFAAKLLSQQTSDGQLDWRQAYGELKMEPHTLSPIIAERCWRLMEALGLAFGCFDFVVTPQGEHVFLEVNEMGQWLFLETGTGMPLLDAFCSFLAAGSVEYPCAEHVEVHYSDVKEEASAAAEASSSEHVEVADGVAVEGGDEEQTAAIA
ncbi:MAG: hypothetical protein WAM82_05525 [Thermoanaerobaculia bacterium]